MRREQKAKIIDDLQNTISRSSIGILADFRGLRAGDMTALRRRLREQGMEFRVVKNTLARLAAEKAGKTSLSKPLSGQVAIAFGSGDATESARSLTSYISAQKLGLTIKGGFLGDRLLTPAEIMILAYLPSRQVLLARVAGGIQSPIVRLVTALSAPLSGLATVLQARIKQLESGPKLAEEAGPATS